MPASATLEDTILANLRPGVAPRDLMRAVRAVHPEATKQEIIHAAFSAMIFLAENSDLELAQALHDFALRSRGS